MEKKENGILQINIRATGKKIKRLREENGLSVRDVQDYFGFRAPQAVYAWERGESLPSTDNLIGLSRLFEVAMDDILVVDEH